MTDVNYSDLRLITGDTPNEFTITIDGKEVLVSDSSNNIVDIAKSAGITIPAPCYLNKRKHGCCSACVVEINGKQHYACGTKPLAGMEVVVKRDDLVALRKERLLKYKDSIDRGVPLKCGSK
ncbi:2Fe-2S iron-sulfur cluster binding domain-containing protein [Puteibacter caeruleilacunae]|nr:2Fe-2S iron-sulfur cluster binding domain-containing protein [Puteibacter caeruleilacunae]